MLASNGIASSRSIERQIEQQAIAQQAATQQQLDVWWHNRFLSAFGVNDEKAIHPGIICLFDALAEVNAIHDKALRKKIEDAKKYAHELVGAFTKELQVRFNELETLVWSHFQTSEKCHVEAMEQIAQRLTGIEDKLTATDTAIDDIKRELADNVTKRIGELEGQRERDAKTSVEQTKTIGDRLIAIEQHSDALERVAADDRKQLNDLEATYWSQRDSDQRQRDEQANKMTEKLNGFAQQVVDGAHEVKEVQRDLRRANDLHQQIRDMELRQDERRIREQAAKRGAKGATGERGPQGERGPVGKDGHAVVLKTKKWETDDVEFLLREVLSDGSRMPAANLRPMIEGNFRPLFEKQLPELDQRYESMVEDMIAKAMRR